MNKNNKKFWQEFSGVYDRLVGEEGDISHKMVINPLVFELLGNLQGKIVLDVGCGNGYLARKMAQTAKKVMGVDFTEKFIELAKKRNQNFTNLTFEVGNLEELHYENESFDVILCNMVLINVEHLEKVVSELARVLKINGSLIISLTHPCFENPPHTYSLKDEKGNNTARVIDNYFSTGLVINTAESNQLHYHYTISDYFNTFSKYKLFLEKIFEPKSYEMMKIKKNDVTPYFLIMRLRKLKQLD